MENVGIFFLAIIWISVTSNRFITPTTAEDNLVPSQFLNLSVEAKIDDGEPSVSHILTIGENDLVPSQPLNLSVLEVNSTNIRLSWIEPQRGNRYIKGYYVYFMSQNYKDARRFEPRGLKRAYIEYTLDKLKPNMEYTIFVKAFTLGNQGEASESVQAKTGRSELTVPCNLSADENDMVPSKPRDLSVLEVNATNIRLSWIVPQRGNGLFDGYFIYLMAWNYTDVRTFKPYPIGLYNEYILSNLKPNMKYTIFVKAFTCKTEGEASESVEVNTGTLEPTNVFCNLSVDENDLVPSKPRNLSVLDVNSNEIRLSWTEPKRGREHIDRYFVYIITLNYTDVRISKTHPMGSYAEYTVGHLKPNTEYTIFVKALTSRNEGEASDSVIVKTDISGPSAPQLLDVTCQSPDTILLQWRRPYHFRNTIDYYLINIYLLDEDILYQNYTLPISQDSSQVSFSIANVTTNTMYRVEVNGLFYNKYTNRLLQSQAFKTNKVYIQTNCDKLQQSNETQDNISGNRG